MTSEELGRSRPKTPTRPNIRTMEHTIMDQLDRIMQLKDTFSSTTKAFANQFEQFASAADRKYSAESRRINVFLQKLSRIHERLGN